jgi:hypothetical protein
MIHFSEPKVANFTSNFTSRQILTCHDVNHFLPFVEKKHNQKNLTGYTNVCIQDIVSA